jgi:hypothetical protein
MNDPIDSRNDVEDDPAPSQAEDEDFYMDGPYVVFTAAFHLKRGFCCNSDCRHCPYRISSPEE